MFLLGNFQYSLDDKNRIRLPAKFRDAEQLGTKYILMPGQNGCMFVYPAKDGQKFIDSLRSSESFDPETAELIRSITEYSAYVEADSQGRFMLPDDLIAICGIKRDVHIVGVMNKVEIWSEERYQERRQKQDLSIKGIDGIYSKLNSKMGVQK